MEYKARTAINRLPREAVAEVMGGVSNSHDKDYQLWVGPRQLLDLTTQVGIKGIV